MRSLWLDPRAHLLAVVIGVVNVAHFPSGLGAFDPGRFGPDIVTVSPPVVGSKMLGWRSEPVMIARPEDRASDDRPDELSPPAEPTGQVWIPELVGPHDSREDGTPSAS